MDSLRDDDTTLRANLRNIATASGMLTLADQLGRNFLLENPQRSRIFNLT